MPQLKDNMSVKKCFKKTFYKFFKSSDMRHHIGIFLWLYDKNKPQPDETKGQTSTADGLKNIAEPSESDLPVDFAYLRFYDRETATGGKRGSCMKSARASADRKLKGTLRAIYKAD